MEAHEKWQEALGPRFVIKFVNGQWVILDRLTFVHAECAGTRKEIDHLYKHGPKPKRRGK